MATQQLERLAQEVKARRAHLGLNQGDLAPRGGPSIVTVGQIERAQIERPQASTLNRLDTSLAWTSGSAAAILRGDTPTPIDNLVLLTRDENSQLGQPVGLGLDAEADGLPLEDVEAIRAQVRALKRARGLDT